MLEQVLLDRIVNVLFGNESASGIALVIMLFFVFKKMRKIETKLNAISCNSKENTILIKDIKEQVSKNTEFKVETNAGNKRL